MSILHDLLSDSRVAVRTAAKSPIGYAVAIVSLAVGLAASTVVLGLMNEMLGQKNRYPNEASLVRLFATSPAACPSCVDGFSLRTYGGWSTSGLSSFERVALFRETTTHGAEDARESVAITFVDDAFFEILGASPVFGRGLISSVSSAAPPAVVSYAFWNSHFAADRSIVGRTTSIAGRQVTLVGVMPRRFRFPESIDIWMSREADAGWAIDSARDKSGVARLKPAVSVGAARAELSLVAQRYAESIDPTEAGRGAVALSPDEWPERAVAGSAIWAVVACVLAVFVLSLINLSSMFFVRVLAREREFAIRRALGASSRRIARQLVAEAMVISAAGAVAGYLIFQAASGKSHQYVATTFDLETFAWPGMAAAGIIVLLGVMSGLFTLLPTALHLRSSDAHEMLRGSSQTTRRQRQLRGALVIGQVSGVFALVAAASLMIRSFATTHQVSSGMSDTEIGVVEVMVDSARADIDVRDKVRLILESARTAAPGSEVALWSWKGLDPGNPRKVVLNATARGDIYSAPGRVGWERPYPAISFGVTAGALALLGIDVVDGRDFNGADLRGSEAVAIVNEEAARLLWPKERAVGQRIKVGGEATVNPWLTVVGVVKGSVHPLRLGLSQSLVTQGRRPALLFRPFDQDPGSLAVLAFRGQGGSRTLDREIQSALQRNRPDGMRMLTTVTSMRDWMSSDGRIQRVRSATQLLTALALVGLLISLLGVYGLVAESVQSRRREFALRLAVGATSIQLVALVARELAKLLALAVVSGLAIAALAAKIGATMLYGYQREIRTGLVYGTTASDPLIYLAAIVATALVVAVGAAAPVRRAIGVAPSEALKSDT